MFLLNRLGFHSSGSVTWTKRTTTGDPPQSSSLRGVCVQGKLITFGGVIGTKAVNSVHALDLGESESASKATC